MKLPIQTLGLMAAGLLIGTALSPVAAQSQQSSADGQVALRSDGALYLLQNGQRRWIATAPLGDSEINAIPEGEPIMTGLALAGSAEAQAKPSAGSGAQAAPPAASGSGSTAKPAAAAPAAGAAPAAAATQAPTPKPTADTGEQLSPEIAIQVDLDGSTTITQGDERSVEIKTKKDVTCELLLRLGDGKEQAEDSKNADSSGRCKYTIEIPDNAPEGNATIVGTVREGGKMNRQELPINVKKK
jgi:hypothetical protein